MSHFKTYDNWYSRLVARFYNPVMGAAEAGFLGEKRQALLGRTSGKVLEVGVGTGANLPYYPSETEVLAIEPAPGMLKYARRLMQVQKMRSNIRLMQAAVDDEAVAGAIPPEGFDYIVCTLVLCTIPDHKAAISLFYQWLAPGGKLLVLEHIGHQRQPARWLQGLLTPAWKHIAEGCHLDRPIDQQLRAGGFRPVEEHYYSRGWIPFYWAALEKTGRGR